jgi:hypothetical protein
MASRFDPRRIAATLCLCLAAASPPLPAKETPAASKIPAPTQARVFADRIAARYGLADFPKVRSIRFTFNVRHDGKDTSREWTWFPAEDSVLFKGKDPKGLNVQAAYSRKNPYSMGSETVAGIDKDFINDEYWLLFPLHLAWDQGLDLKLGEGGVLVVRYPQQGGSAPRDAFDLSADSAGTIRSWVFYRGGADTGAMRADWANLTNVDGLPLSLERTGQKGFKVWFTGVKVVGIKG